MKIALNLIFLCLALPAVLPSAYLLLLTLLSFSSIPVPRSARRLRFDVVVPAHNEEQVIERTVTSLNRIDWPKDLFRIVVIADNCNDQTADIARRGGAMVIARQDPVLRGKGYALAAAFELSAAQEAADAIVVVDADSEVSTNLLEAFGARIERGAAAVQAHYGVLNARASWRTCLMAVALGAIHRVRSRAREKLRVSCGIRGNGWCITHQTLKHVPYDAFSLTEDIEYGIKLGLAGYRVAYADEADVLGEMVTSEVSARSQRQRWEHGRFHLIRSKIGGLLAASIQRRSKVCFDLAIDLLVLPLSYIVLDIVVLFLLAAAALLWRPAMLVWLWLAVGSAGALALYVLRGWRLSGIGMQGLVAMTRIPGFLVWKLLLVLRQSAPANWVRTDRNKN
jgi:cellulose synthase/poly-beta-1,6-N-acetylglucosamine synthase-like glycosyltransferase